MFQPGDKVRVSNRANNYFGLTGVVRVYDSSNNEYIVRTSFDNNQVAEIIVYGGDLELTAHEEHNEHYKAMGISPWDVVDTWPLEQRIGVYRFEVLKYIMRLEAKEERLKQAEKALTCCEKLASTVR